MRASELIQLLEKLKELDAAYGNYDVIVYEDHFYEDMHLDFAHVDVAGRKIILSEDE